MSKKLNEKKIIKIILKEFPSCQAIYLFGSFATGDNNDNSDVDIAVLLPHEIAKQKESLIFTNVHHALRDEVERDVDLINLRLTSTVLQKEVIFKGMCIFCADRYAKAEFEMLTMSLYQKLNFERKEILEEFYARRTK